MSGGMPLQNRSLLMQRRSADERARGTACLRRMPALCDGVSPRLPAMSRNALGRDIPICATCGMAEAVRDLAKQPPIPYNEWPVDPDELGREYAATARWRQPGQPLDTIPESWEERS